MVEFIAYIVASTLVAVAFVAATALAWTAWGWLRGKATCVACDARFKPIVDCQERIWSGTSPLCPRCELVYLRSEYATMCDMHPPTAEKMATVTADVFGPTNPE